MSEDQNRKKSLFRRVKRDNVTDMPSTPKAKGKDYGYSAFTSPVEKDYSPYSPQTLSSLSQESEQKEEIDKVKKTGVAKFFAIGLVALALIVISSFATYLFSHYDFQLSSGNGVIKFALIPRLGNVPPDKGQQSPPAPTASKDPSEQQTPQPTIPTYSTPDGTSMIIGSPSFKTLSLKEIFDKCAPSVAAIHSESPDGMQNAAGIIISPNGFIVTNQHITYGASTITVTLENGAKYSAALVGEDEQTDIAVIKIEAKGLTPAEFADYSRVSVGDSVLTIGNAVNQSLSMVDGIITAINRNVSYNGFTTTLLQTNAYINSGNSGGPLINTSGQVIAITNASLVFSASAFRGIGFAFPAITAKPIVDEILKVGYVKGRPSLGLRLSDIAVSAYAYYKLPKGVYVSRVYTNSDAYAKGVQPGDVICSIEGKDVATLNELTGLVNTYAVGNSVKVKIYRNGSYADFDIKLMDKADFK